MNWTGDAIKMTKDLLRVTYSGGGTERWRKRTDDFITDLGMKMVCDIELTKTEYHRLLWIYIHAAS